MDLAAREALSGFLRSELRTELAGDLDRIFTELEELRLRFNIVERLIGIPTGLPTGARLRQHEAVRLRAQGCALNEIAAALHVSIGTVKNDLARERAVAAANGNVANGKPLGDPRDRVV